MAKKGKSIMRQLVDERGIKDVAGVQTPMKLKEFHRVATRYDKHACRYLGFVHLACIRIRLA